MQDELTALVQVRRELHQFAEPGWCEVGACATVVTTLRELGIDVRFGQDVVRADARLGLPSPETMRSFYEGALRRGASREVADKVRGGFTGVVGTLRGTTPGPVMAVRMDLDANLGLEADIAGHVPAQLGFRSSHEGVHHNCGHDGHTSIGLGLARFLARRRHELRGEVRLIFQPAEEGLRGAQSMVSAGVLDGVNLFFGFHLGVQALTTGELIAGYRNILASVKFDATFTGTGAHAAISPHVGRNALLAAASAMQGLLSLPRHGDGETRVNVGHLSGGDSRNTIPSSARMEAEVRADTTEILDGLCARAEEVVRGAAAMQGVAVRIDPVGRSSAGNSDPELAAFVAEVAGSVAAVRSIRLSADFKGSDDAAVMMSEVQRNGGLAVYMGFGTPLAGVHHNPLFDFDENAMALGVDLLGLLVLRGADFARHGGDAMGSAGAADGRCGRLPA